MFTRRRIIQASTSVLAAAALTAGIGFEAVRLAPAAPGSSCLSARELVLVQALAESLFPPGSPLGVTAVGMDLAPEVDELIGDRLDPVVTPVFRHVLQALDDGTLLSRGTRFADLPLEARIEVIAAWAEPGVLARRIMYDALRTIVGMVFFCRPEVNAVVGWSPACASQTRLGAISTSRLASSYAAAGGVQ